MNLKVLHISSRDTGGAGIAALRLHKSMLDYGVQSRFLCLEKTSSQAYVEVFPKFYPRFYQRFLQYLGMPMTQGQKNEKRLQKLEKFIQPEMFSFLRSDYQIHKHDLFNWAEVIIIHWAAGFLDYPTFFKNILKHQKVFWYSHDFSVILGGFHTLYDKVRFVNPKIIALEAELQQKKRKYLSHCKELTFIGNSHFTYKTLLEYHIAKKEKVHCVPLGLPENELKSIEKSLAKAALGLNKDSLIVLTTSVDLNVKRKGFDRLIKILEATSKRVDDILLLTLGSNHMEHTITNIKIHHMGSVWQNKFKSIIFSAADVVVSTAYEETFGQTIIEGYACCTPAIVFNNAALPEMIIPEETGYIANTIEEFENYLVKLSSDRVKASEMGNQALTLYKEKYTSEQQVKTLLELF